MPVSEISPCLKESRINRRLLPIKLHFFFLYGATGGVIPFLPLVGKELGISATAVGIVYTVLPFMVMFSKPAFGALTDHLQNLKLVMIPLIVIASCSFYAVLYIPPIPQETNSTYVYSTSKCEKYVTSYNVSEDDLAHLNALLTKIATECDRNYGNKNYSCFNELRSVPNIYDIMSINTTPLLSYNSALYENKKNLCNCENVIFHHTKLSTCFRNSSSDAKINPYKTTQFWIYALLAILSGTCTATLFSLSDAACYEILGTETQLYGKQRLWATISWGSVTLLTGYLNDLVSAGCSATNYSPGFYLLLGLVAIDLIVLFRTSLAKANFSSSICKDIGHMFSSFKIVIFGIGVFIIGGLTGLLWQYQLWFLQDLGADQLLLGLTVAVQCLAAEVPFFFASGKIINLFGYMYCLVGSFAAFALRYALYFFLKNPWLVLPIELLHGVTYGVFYATMTSFANLEAPPGTEATMMGVLGGLFEGLGLAVGSLLGGVGFDTLKARYTFLVASMLSAVCSITLFLIRSTTKIESVQQNNQDAAA